jgi:nucleoside-diphosphate-sugar epimerase
MTRSALVVGATGIIGNNLARHLHERGWQVYGLARRPVPSTDGVLSLTADLLDAPSLRTALQGVRPTDVFISAWLRQRTEKENITINRTMVRNILDALSPLRTVKHVALVTGLKHYLGPFESYGEGKLPTTPFREEQPRLDIDNFYYAQEDEIFAAAERDGFSWSIHRPHTIIGYAVGNAMNMGLTLAVYATICQETGHPFRFPGSATQWRGLTDMTDARLLARHLEWAAVTTAARNQAFNVVNGDVFRWSWMWERLADWFGIRSAPYPGEGVPLEGQLAGADSIWKEISRRHNLKESDISAVTSAWHTDADLGRPIEVVTDMSKSRKLGFLDYQATDSSFVDLFVRLREEHVIP